MTDLGSVYGAARQRVTELVSGLSDDEAKQTVPACPEWRVHDVLAHLSGVCDDIVSGNLEGVATDPWTAAQVDKRRDWPLAKILDEWAEKAAEVEPIVQFFPGRVNEQFVLDMTTHEHDLRHALGRPGAQDSEAVDVAVRFVVEVGFLANVGLRGLPALEVVAGDHRWVAGGLGSPVALDEAGIRAAVGEAVAGVVTSGTAPMNSDAEPAGSLKVSAFDLMRALSGRRSQDQIAAFGWSVDPTPYLPAFQFGPFTTRPDPLDE